MPPPEFWDRRGFLSALLAPVSLLYAAAGGLRRRFARPWRAPVPVVCVGALTVGGAGKTPAALAIAARLKAQGARPHILSRGYRGRLRGPVEVDPAVHTARDVGDEALLLAAAAPTWVARNRAVAAQAAIAAGADILVLDDGFQNPRLAKNLSLVVIDGGNGVGNGRTLPAGPLREPMARGLSRADAVVLVGRDRTGIAARIPRRLPLLRARLVPDPADAALLRGKPVLAFAGLGRPQKFTASLEEIGAKPAIRRDFPDHHPYREREIEALVAEARQRDAVLVTTSKDAVRIGRRRDEIHVLRVTLEFERPAELDRLLTAVKADRGKLL